MEIRSICIGDFLRIFVSLPLFHRRQCTMHFSRARRSMYAIAEVVCAYRKKYIRKQHPTCNFSYRSSEKSTKTTNMHCCVAQFKGNENDRSFYY